MLNLFKAIAVGLSILITGAIDAGQNILNQIQVSLSRSLAADTSLQNASVTDLGKWIDARQQLTITL